MNECLPKASGAAGLTCDIGDEALHCKEETKAKLEHTPEHHNAHVDEEDRRPVA